MRITIEDLEALKELNDELEENHVETEKQLHEDLGKTTCLCSYHTGPHGHPQIQRNSKYVNMPRR
jgi:hypothetical protein